MGADIAQSLFIILCYFSFGSADNYIHTGLFWHLTDVHVDLDYEKHACQGPLGDQRCDSPLSLWLSALNATRQMLHTAPDFIVFSGSVLGIRLPARGALGAGIGSSGHIITVD